MLTLALLVPASRVNSAEPYRRLPVEVYRDRMKAGWIGQMVGVAWGAPTEFHFEDRIIPEADMPKWRPGIINNAFLQDDLYVEMIFLRTLEKYGFGVSIRQAGIDFANLKCGLACANHAGRDNLRDGIAPPDSGHPKFNCSPNDIDYQIESDFSGLIAPGLPGLAVALGEMFGRLMNYGDGVYGGQFMGGCYTEAFFESDPVKIVRAGLRCIPAESQYAEMVRDMLRWHRENPTDWQKTWHLAQKKYREDPAYQKASNGGIDVKINGAYVLMGLLYGQGDPDRTIIISCRCGQDSDCNPSSAAGVLFTSLGCARLPERYTQALDATRVFDHTEYTFPRMLEVCEKLARQAVVRAGGRIEKEADGSETFVIPVREPKPSPLQLSWAPGPITGSRYTPEEMARIVEPSLRRSFEAYAPGWTMSGCGWRMGPGVYPEIRGRKNVYLTHPAGPTTPVVLSTTAELPAGRRSRLKLLVGHPPEGDWLLIVRADGRELLRKPVGPDTSNDGWMPVEVDLSTYAGQTVKLEVLNAPTGWGFQEGAYWAEIGIEHE